MGEFGMAIVAMIVGAFWGAIGQFIRAVIGLQKRKASREKFNGSLLLWSLLIGALAGALAGLAFSWGQELERGEILALVAAGYAGADFIEGLLKSKLPGVTDKSVA